MRLGPLRFLAAVGGGVAFWVAGRAPAVMQGARNDVAASAAPAAEQVAALSYPVGSSVVPRPAATPAVIPPPSIVRLQRLPAARTAPRSLGMPVPVGRDDIVAGAALAVADEVEVPVPRPAPVALAPGFAAATAGYAELARGSRRAAARAFAAALAADPAAPNAAAWQAEAARLERRWSGDAYVLVRGSGPTGLGVVPLLGGGQSGASLAFAPDPLMRHPLSIVARISAAHDGFGYQRGTVQAALGARLDIVGAILGVERLTGSREAWAVRAAGGTSQRVGPLDLDAYAEAGVVGARRRDLFASAQARAIRRLPLGIDAGGAAWGSIQHAGSSVHRVDAGPTIGWRSAGISARADWRIRVAGNAAPSSGPALTLAVAF